MGSSRGGTSSSLAQLTQCTLCLQGDLGPRDLVCFTQDVCSTHTCLVSLACKSTLTRCTFHPCLSTLLRAGLVGSGRGRMDFGHSLFLLFCPKPLLWQRCCLLCPRALPGAHKLLSDGLPLALAAHFLCSFGSRGLPFRW